MDHVWKMLKPKYFTLVMQLFLLPVPILIKHKDLHSTHYYKWCRINMKEHSLTTPKTDVRSMLQVPQGITEVAISQFKYLVCHFPTSQVKRPTWQTVCSFTECFTSLLFSFWPQNLNQIYIFLNDLFSWLEHSQEKLWFQPFKFLTK